MDERDVDSRLVAAGRVLRSKRHSSPAHAVMRALCADPAWSTTRDEIAMTVECRAREMGEAIDRYEAGGAMDWRDLARQRDEFESLRRALEEIERRLDDLDTAEFVAREIDGMVRDAREIDAWIEVNEDECRRAGVAWPVTE